MESQKSTVLIFFCVLFLCCLLNLSAQNATETLEQFKRSLVKDTIPLAPEQYKRPMDFKPFRYKYSLTDLKSNFSDEMMLRSAKQYEIVTDVNNKGKWKPTPESIDSHETPEWFKDAKFGMFIDWGLWSVAGWAPKRKKGAMYPDWYENRMYNDSVNLKYHEKNWGKDFERDDFISLFTAKEYNPEMLAKLAVEAGMKYVIPFSKHHSGFCLWESSYTQRNAVNMGPKRDLIKPLVDQCRQRGLKFGFYFSVEDWEYPIINNEGVLVERLWGGKIVPYSVSMENNSSGKVAVKNFSKDYLVPQATEFIDKYNPDILWYDGEWESKATDFQTYDIAAYFYNRAQGKKEVAVNDRYGLDKDRKKLRFKRGDIFTSEFHDNDDKVQSHSWEANRGISQSFGFNWQDTDNNVISTKEFVKMFVDIVSRGGNLLLIVNLDGQGKLPLIQEKRLKDIGKWLKVNAESIYATRCYDTKSEGSIRYTRSKNNKTIYAIATEWPGNHLNLKSVIPQNGTKIYLLGVKENLKWNYSKNEGLTIEIPRNLQNESNRPCEYAYSFRIENN